jgi:hypothetical protein
MPDDIETTSVVWMSSAFSRVSVRRVAGLRLLGRSDDIFPCRVVSPPTPPRAIGPLTGPTRAGGLKTHDTKRSCRRGWVASSPCEIRPACPHFLGTCHPPTEAAGRRSPRGGGRAANGGGHEGGMPLWTTDPLKTRRCPRRPRPVPGYGARPHPLLGFVAQIRGSDCRGEGASLDDRGAPHRNRDLSQGGATTGPPRPTSREFARERPPCGASVWPTLTPMCAPGPLRRGHHPPSGRLASAAADPEKRPEARRGLRRASRGLRGAGCPRQPASPLKDARGPRRARTWASPGADPTPSRAGSANRGSLRVAVDALGSLTRKSDMKSAGGGQN